MEQGKNPRDVKFELAQEIVTRFHSKAVAEQAQQNFIERFRKGKIPDDLAEQTVTANGDSIGIAHLLKAAGLVSSTSDGVRMIRQGAVKINGQKISDSHLAIKVGDCAIYQVGKRRFAKIKVC